jgi:hypothetical protein
MAQSKFILCPRGIGVSTWRLFETMRAGRVPVIMADDWVPSIGPKWQSFAVFVREAEVQGVPELLERLEDSAETRGAVARKEWRAWYARDVIFNTTVDLLLRAQSRRGAERRIVRALRHLQYLQPYFLRHWVLGPMKRYLLETARAVPQR